jgi:6-phosphogluconolactonase
MNSGPWWKGWQIVMAILAAGMVSGCNSSSEAATQTATAKPPHLFWVFVGTYTQTLSKGIYLLKFDADSGELSPPALAAEIDDPNSLAVPSGNRFLYTVGTAYNHRLSMVDAFSLDSRSGKLSFLNQQSSGGSGATHIGVDPAGTIAVVANYNSGDVGVLRINPDGTLGPPSQVIQHIGSSVNPQRQQHAFPHSCNFDPAGRFVLVPDLGTDKIYTYHFERADHTLMPGTPATVDVAPGTGPRHMAFGPDGRFAYVVGEMGGTVTVFAYDAAHGALRPLQTISTLPADYHGANTSAEVAVHPSGKFLYVSNRGPDDIAIFRIEQDGAHLTPAGFCSTLGKGPRCFAIDPTGKFLFAANQRSDSLVVFRIDPQNGGLTPTGAPVQIGMPVSILFVPIGD